MFPCTIYLKYFSHFFTFQILNCLHDFVGLFVPLNFNLGVILVFFKIIQKFVHVFPKLIDFFDHYIMFFSISYPEILNREYFYRTRGLFFGGGRLIILAFHIACVFVMKLGCMDLLNWGCVWMRFYSVSIRCTFGSIFAVA